MSAHANPGAIREVQYFVMPHRPSYNQSSKSINTKSVHIIIVLIDSTFCFVPHRWCVLIFIKCGSVCTQLIMSSVSAAEVELDLRQRKSKSSNIASAASVCESDETIARESIFGRNGPPPFLSRRPLPVRTTIAAISLLIIGVVFIISALVVFYRHGTQESIPFWCIGAIGNHSHLHVILCTTLTRCVWSGFIPGSYNTVMIYRAYKGEKGYSYDQIPSYDD